jgi:hypothetical protein
MPKYKCCGCGEIHNDNDYSSENGDVLIPDLKKETCKHHFIEVKGNVWWFIYAFIYCNKCGEFKMII